MFLGRRINQEEMHKVDDKVEEGEKQNCCLGHQFFRASMKE